MLDSFPQKERLIALGRQINGDVGSVIIAYGGANRVALTSAHDGQMLSYAARCGMNRSGIKKLHKRIFDQARFLDIQDSMFIEEVEERLSAVPCDGPIPTYISDGFVRKIAVFEIETFNAFELKLRITRRSFWEKLLWGI